MKFYIKISPSINNDIYISDRYLGDIGEYGEMRFIADFDVNVMLSNLKYMRYLAKLKRYNSEYWYLKIQVVK